MSAASSRAANWNWRACACWPTLWKTPGATRWFWRICAPRGRTCAGAGRWIWRWAGGEGRGSRRHVQRRAVTGLSLAAAVDAFDAFAGQAQDAVEARQPHAVEVRAGVGDVGEQGD